MKPEKIRITTKVVLVSEHTNLAMSEKAEEASTSAGAGTEYPPNELLELHYYSVLLIG
jgi:hypothetical protein